MLTRNALQLTKSLSGANGVQFRTSVVVGPPRNRISITEKIVLGLVISAGCCAVPAWVLSNMKYYRSRSD